MTTTTGAVTAEQRAAWERDGCFRIEGFVENLFNKDYIKDAGNTGDSIGMATFIPGEPRTYGVQLTARF